MSLSHDNEPDATSYLDVLMRSENPYPYFAQLRANKPIAEIPHPFQREEKAWIVTRLEDAVQLLKDNKRFVINHATIDGGDVLTEEAERITNTSTFLLKRTMLNADGLDHKRLRGLVSKAFTPRYIESLRPAIQRIADDLLDKVQDTGQMDLVRDYAYPLPINVISDVLGVPVEDRGRIYDWSKAIASGMGEHVDPIRDEKLRAFAKYVTQLVVEKRRHPQDDLVSQLVQIEEEGERLSEGELLSTVGLLIFAGHETTSNMIGMGTLLFLDHPEQLAALKADPSLIPAALEEILRIRGPVTMTTPRYAAEDGIIAGQPISRGDLLLIILESTNHDETQFTDPDELDIARQIQRHLAFGYGVHICLGAPLARLEGEIAFSSLFRRMPHLRLAVPRTDITWRRNFTLRGVSSLPVAF